MNEFWFFAIVVAFVAVHVGGNSWNKRKATKWMKSQADALRSQFFQVGFDETVTTTEPSQIPESKYLKRVSPVDYVFYATGRLNISLLHGKISLLTRHNIIMLVFEYVFSFLLSTEPPKDVVEFIVRPTDSDKSSYDGFVFAIVNKEIMKRVREESYDLSLTRTSDHPKLPVSCTVMSEAAEITETLFTPELLDAVKAAESVLQYLVISDLPVDRPKTVEEYVPKKRALLSVKIANTPEQEQATVQLVNAFLNTVDLAVAKAHWRPEVSRKLKATRDDEIRKLKKIADEEKAEELAKQRAKEKKEQKQEIGKLTAEEQRKAQTKEREKEIRRQRTKQVRKA
ncbi:hypothetical protein V1525DRAFT_346976 [Lipomyces kononenkoae]|uniref:Uncharacterized protein n=1 Tax=Lipomyces kononenkoae TaxID=34357 RepID=A0ACC3SX68_LIPKO